MDIYDLEDRDLSWLGFNDRLLDEASRESLPLLERVRFLSIFSSNLDEFYRVRMPALLALQKIHKKQEPEVYQQVVSMIDAQQHRFGRIFNDQLIPALAAHGYLLCNDGSVPAELHQFAVDCFYTRIAGFLTPVLLSDQRPMFPENNQLYLAVVTRNLQMQERIYLVNVPGADLPRFQSRTTDGKTFLLFLEDLIRHNLAALFPGQEIVGSWNIKVTRDAELNLQDEYSEDLADKIEKQLFKRDQGFATRFLYEPGFPLRHLEFVIRLFGLQKASVVEGGRHHNLKDLADLPLRDAALSYPPWPAAETPESPDGLFAGIMQGDILINPPYQSYDRVLRFFNEAAIDHTVEEVYTTLYRVASDSRIARALITAARNGKKVFVLVELKARFDEANNIRWAKRMKAAGVRIVYSDPQLKVHAKVALVRRRSESLPLLGLLATGNLNETTARFYTDHILLTANQLLLGELAQLFELLGRRLKPDTAERASFSTLLVARFNLKDEFIRLIRRERRHALSGLPSGIIIKLNNLEEEEMIRELYEASGDGVRIQLIVRGICRLKAGVPGQSEHITVRRIVDRYLEHGRIFLFHNAGEPAMWMGSADWMNRNLHHRIEVCFPVLDPGVRSQMIRLLEYQLADNVQAVDLAPGQLNHPVSSPVDPVTGDPAATVRSQEAIYRYLSGPDHLRSEKALIKTIE